MEILPSALRHDVEVPDIHHAVQYSMVVEDIEDDPSRYLVLGPDRASNLLELVVLDRPQGPAVIQAMPKRAQYRRLLARRRQR